MISNKQCTYYILYFVQFLKRCNYNIILFNFHNCNIRNFYAVRRCKLSTTYFIQKSGDFLIFIKNCSHNLYLYIKTGWIASNNTILLSIFITKYNFFQLQYTQIYIYFFWLFRPLSLRFGYDLGRLIDGFCNTHKDERFDT